MGATSTLLALLARLMDPTAGSIRHDGIDLRQVSLVELRSRIAVVLQEPFLLPLSVADNIAFGVHTTHREHVEEAAHLACADEFIPCASTRL